MNPTECAHISTDSQGFCVDCGERPVIAEAMKRGCAEERAAIVAWLREEVRAHGYVAALNDAADAIERGDYRRGKL